MKKKIKIKDYGFPMETHGNWYDLRATETVTMSAPHLIENGKLEFDHKMIKLNLTIDLPKWYELQILPRSSTYKEWGLIMVNSEGIIDGEDNDNSGFNGDNDVVRFNATAFKNTMISKGDRIAQFKIVLNQKAPWYIKIKDLFYSGFKFDVVDILHNKNRGGIGTSGRN